MVFGFDDVIEGITAAEVLGFLSTAIFGASEGATTTIGEGGTLVIQDLLGDEGLEATIDLIKGEVSAPMNHNITDSQIEETLEEVWNNIGKIDNSGITKEGLINRSSVIAEKLINKGIDVKSDKGNELLNTIINKALNLGKEGIRKTLDPKIIAGSTLLGTSGRKLMRGLRHKIDPPRLPFVQQKLISNLPI